MKVYTVVTDAPYTYVETFESHPLTSLGAVIDSYSFSNTIPAGRHLYNNKAMAMQAVRFYNSKGIPARLS